MLRRKNATLTTAIAWGRSSAANPGPFLQHISGLGRPGQTLYIHGSLQQKNTNKISGCS
jgi:hypothetical protein